MQNETLELNVLPLRWRAVSFELLRKVQYVLYDSWGSIEKVFFFFYFFIITIINFEKLFHFFNNTYYIRQKSWKN